MKIITTITVLFFISIFNTGCATVGSQNQKQPTAENFAWCVEAPDVNGGGTWCKVAKITGVNEDGEVVERLVVLYNPETEQWMGCAMHPTGAEKTSIRWNICSPLNE